MAGDFALDQDFRRLSENTKHSIRHVTGHPDRAGLSDCETKVFGAPQTAVAQTADGAPLLPSSLQCHPRYEILDFLGAGGMGTVYKARHRIMGRTVALKMIHPDWADQPAMVERFRGEIRAVARLCHPNIVVAFDAERTDDADLLVMEYVEGMNLEQFLARQGAPVVPQVCEHIRQAALGLQHAWEQGMVHRDIKPQNLMLTPQGQIKILDFGLARVIGEGTPSAAETADIVKALGTRQFDDAGADPASEAATPHWRGRRLEEMAAGYPLGTVDYLAPEEVDDPRRSDIRADIYSLGCTLYRCLAGRVPFTVVRLVDKIKAHQHRTPTPVNELCPAAPPDLARLVARMMAKNPAERFQTPGAVAHALAPFAA